MKPTSSKTRSPPSSNTNTPPVSGGRRERRQRAKLRQAELKSRAESLASTPKSSTESLALASTSQAPAQASSSQVQASSSKMQASTPLVQTSTLQAQIPTASTSHRSGQHNGDMSKSHTSGFEEGEDFIPFTFADDALDDEAYMITEDKSGSAVHKSKGKEREKGQDEGEEKVDGDKRQEKSKRGERGREPEPDDERQRDRHRERDEESEKDRGRDKDRDRDKRAREREQEKEKERTGRDKEARDRDGDRRGTKREYEMVFDFDPNDGYASKKQRMDASSRKCPWTAGLDWDRCHHVAEMLHKEVEAFVKWISPSPVEDEVRGLVVSLISRAVTSAFPDASVLPFGSYETKLYLPLGDIDLVIMSESMAYSDKVTVLHALANTIKRAGITQRVTIIAKAKVPIVKFVTTHGRFNVDISINQANGIVSGKIINGFLRDMHGTGGGSVALRSLVMITKAFLSQRSMNEVFTGGLGSYSIVCLAISFLQMHPKIRMGEIDAEQNLGVLVMEFFELYGLYFNYEEVGISVRDGGTYFSKKQRGWHDYYKGGLLSIEDPADPSNDISRGSYGFQKVRATFAGAHSILASTAYMYAGIISSRRSGHAIHLRGPDEPDEWSILASVMGITQETINHRKLVQEVYDKRILHNILGVKPQPSIGTPDSKKKPTNGSGSSKPSSLAIRGASSVKTAWHEAEAEPELFDENDHKRRRDEDDDEGRYKINRQQPPKKRRRTGRVHDNHTVFTTDEDEDEEGVDEEGDSEVEDAHYASDDGGSSRTPRDQEKADKRRSYWLSKAIGMDDGSIEGLVE
ncbi:Poly(A) RNA polymerase cid14 [Hypsizygus marmoreus]|uniref:polynucleotide adenylyltransferase n=1 Tax=Hypsizygus marmoreus TaxID=39966 RepID=A0A369JPA4_HYPMA|nr:Poly(A) RNA polymerase cid14 [Hypsizygus marmoreus]